MAHDNKDVAIVIPVYKPFDCLIDSEVASIRQCFKILTSYEVYFVGPEKLEYSQYIDFGEERGVEVKVVAYSDHFFDDIAGYNKLMLSKSFYDKFTRYKYILLYQTDAWIFRDELTEWCNKGYDYVGAPWVNWKWSDFAARHISVPRTIFTKLGYSKYNLVGNGGFSLRKVSSVILNLQLFKSAAASFKENEDYFFSFYITSYNPFFKIPNVQTALRFCFDENPEESYLLNDKNLPMACHAWPKYSTFWNKIIGIK